MLKNAKKYNLPAFSQHKAGFQFKAVVLQPVTQNWQYGNMTLLDVKNSIELNWPLVYFFLILISPVLELPKSVPSKRFQLL